MALSLLKLQLIPHSPTLLLGIAQSLLFVALATRCPFESVTDKLHRQEVELLRPGTLLPTAQTVSTDVRRIYEDTAKGAARYLQLVPGALHLALDGWTSPTHESYLGVVVFWFAEGKIWRTVLEFIRLTEAHTGDYLAKRVQDCLKRFGIEEKKILSICADNAGNNDTLSVRLHELVPLFAGPKARTRCFAHILNLMAKVFMLLFTTPSCCSKAGGSSSDQNHTAPTPNNPNQEPDNSIDEVDPDKLEHDDVVVKGLVHRCYKLWHPQHTYTQVAALAQHVNDSTALMVEFKQLVESDPSVKGDAKTQVQLLTNNSKHKVRQHALSSKQWDLAHELCQVLAIFEEPTNLFSQKEVPLIHEVIPIMLTLCSRLYDVRDDILQQGLHPITRVAAQAALLVWDKYMGAILEQLDIYLIAMVMCPDCKLKWFAERSEFDVNKIYCRVINCFITQNPSQPESVVTRQPLDNGNIWTQQHTSSAAPPPQLERDSMTEYLSMNVENSAVVAQSGGVLGYWSSRLAQRPRVARFALDFLTAQATPDVDPVISGPDGGRILVRDAATPSLDDIARMLEKHILALSPIFLVSATLQVVRKSLNFGPRPNAHYITRAQSTLGANVARDPYDVAKSFLSNYTLCEYYIRSDSYTDRSTGVTYVYARQRIGQFEVANGDINLNILDGQVVSYGDSVISTTVKLLPRPPSGRGLHMRDTALSWPTNKFIRFEMEGQNMYLLHGVPTNSLSTIFKTAYSSRCLRAAVDATNMLHRRDPYDPRWAPLYFMVAAHPDQATVDDLVVQTLISNVPGSVSPVETRLVYVQSPDENGSIGLHLAWQRLSTGHPTHLLRMPALAPRTHGQSPSTILPAKPNPGLTTSGNGELTTQITEPGSQPVRQSPPIATSDEQRSKDEYLRFSSTWGNNVFAQEKLAGRKRVGGQASTRVGSGMKFDYDIDMESSPRAYANASITQLFYTTNMVHDLFYRYGFDEVSGNFQQDNYGRGDGTVMQSSLRPKMEAPPDGKNGRCRMYLWDFSSPYRDGALDAGILIHELTHGLSNRLTGGL
ncbi:peptidase M36 family [Rhizoctonia solani]|uniref:Peptidase M36 family n=1 Tax=Rhizoctonia solani TaxID=456999 RepID=A0A8H7I6S5_9AGAM|nr:peptidase M36 family [Rhizoctonia solani]